LSKIDFFKFEDSGIDFPFYGPDYFPLNNYLKIIVLGLSIITIFILSGTFIGTVISLFLLGYVSNWNLSSIIKKPKLSDLKIIIPMLILEIIVSFALIVGESFTPMYAINNPLIQNTANIFEFLDFFIGIFSEELVKISILLFIAYIIYGVTNNRKLSIITGSFISLTTFGLLHYPMYLDVIHCILLGYTSIFTLFTYLKTKNVISSYAVHIIYDIIIFLLI